MSAELFDISTPREMQKDTQETNPATQEAHVVPVGLQRLGMSFQTSQARVTGECPVVFSVRDGSWAHEQGIAAGMRLTAVDGKCCCALGWNFVKWMLTMQRPLKLQVTKTDTQETQEMQTDTQQEMRTEMKTDLQDMHEMKKDIQDTLQEMRTNMQEMKRDIQAAKTDLQDMQEMTKDLQDILQEMRTNLQEMKKDIQVILQEMRTNMQEMKRDIQAANTDIQDLQEIIDNLAS